MSMILSVVAWTALSVVLMAFLEYALHRWPMHSRAFARRFPFAQGAFERHSLFHHGRFYRIAFDRDPDPIARHFNIDLDPGFALLFGSPMWGLLWLLGCPTGAACLAATSALHAIVWSAVHREMHDPRGRWFAKSAYYRFIHDNHERHHDRPGCNFAVVLPPFVDKLFGTYRRPG